LFPWARFCSTKAAIKLHTLLDLRGPIPSMIAISDGKQADVKVLDELILEPGAFYVMDRGYGDFERLYRFVLAGAFFVTRAKAGLRVNRLESRPVDESTGARSDQIVWLMLPKSVEHYPDRFRRVSCRDPETNKALVFLTNNFDLSPLVIAQLYKGRWRVELFFNGSSRTCASNTFSAQRGQDASLDRRVRLRAGRHRAQRAWTGTWLVANFASFERQCF
jgi:hypothetical protein